MSTHTRHLGYWATTGLLALGMAAGGAAQVLRLPFNVEGIIHLGYPPYVLGILGPWKLLGAVVLLLPRFRLVKEWAYAGFFFLLSGATLSHVASGDGPARWTAPLVFALLTAGSWWLRPESRRLVPAPTIGHCNRSNHSQLVEGSP